MPYFLSFEFVGYYKIFSQLALLLGFGMMAVNIPQAYVISKNILDKNHNMTDHLVNGLKFSFLYYLLLSFIYFSIGINLVETFFGKNLTLYMNLLYHDCWSTIICFNWTNGSDIDSIKKI